MVHFRGTITEANGGLMHLTVSGPAHFIFSKSYTQSFDEPMDLAKGSYTVSMSAATPGKFIFNITGNFISIDPSVPDSFNNLMHMYDLKV